MTHSRPFSPPVAPTKRKSSPPPQRQKSVMSDSNTHLVIAAKRPNSWLWLPNTNLTRLHHCRPWRRCNRNSQKAGHNVTPHDNLYLQPQLQIIIWDPIIDQDLIKSLSCTVLTTLLRVAEVGAWSRWLLKPLCVSSVDNWILKKVKRACGLCHVYDKTSQDQTGPYCCPSCQLLTDKREALPNTLCRLEFHP